ncbi:hypothetical protein FJZ20_01080 [Candidatus Pacearchaeota archaeon]|nr:hypothetical protein [Candidatus Pacearchaeota archaeon]
MIIKEITLSNIRSYKKQTLIFPEGSTLLSGDIGSGKTSVLLGIEFALFGLQPGQRGASLLRNGEKDGGVILKLNVDNKDIILERTLKKGKTITQDYCTITIDNEKQELSVTEIKDRVLSILNYPREFAKKQNILYKFTVYTPQEEMKQIILEDPEIRLNALRHVFGIDKYKKIIENGAILTSKLREERRILEGKIDSLDSDKENLISKEMELELKQFHLALIEKELSSKTYAKKSIQEEIEKILEKIDERKKLKQEVEKTKIMLSNKQEIFTSNSKILEQIEAQIKELSLIEFKEEKIKEAELEISVKKKERIVLNDELLKTASQINSLKIKNQDNEAIKKKLISIDICPTCLQDVGSVYKSNIVNKLDSEISDNLKNIARLELEKERIIKTLSQIETQISLGEKRISELNLLKIKLQEIEEKTKRLREIKKINESLLQDMQLLQRHMESLSKSIFELNKFEKIFEIKQKELEESAREEKFTEIKIAEGKKEIEVFSRHIFELKERIRKTEEIREKLNYIIALETWISKNFIPLISVIEKNVMIKLKHEFSRLFAKWFSMLVSENFEARLDDSFTPIVEYQDYEIDYTYLSGGERTAVALAYRLSLNQVLNSLLSKIKTKDLVILDEPTDGFSEQQLDKIREVLDQLNTKQLIIVSHEQKIESFVDNVIKFKKEYGISKVISENFIK